MRILAPEKKSDTLKADLTLLEGNIVKMVVHDESYLEEKDVYDLHEAKLKLIGAKNHAVLLIAGKDSSISKEARELSATEEIEKNRFAKAIVISSLAHKIIGNFFIKVNKPVKPVKLFSDEKKALIWLREYRAGS